MVDHPRTTPTTNAPTATTPDASAASDEPADHADEADEAGSAGSPLELGTKLAVQASLRYHGRMSMGTVRAR